MLQYPSCVAVYAYLVNAVHGILLNLEEKARGELVVVCASVEERWRGVRKHLRRHEVVCFDGCLHVVLCVRDRERGREKERERERECEYVYTWVYIYVYVYAAYMYVYIYMAFLKFAST